MGWAYMPKIGSKAGPCKGECTHIDCAQTRRDAACPCAICSKPIGYDVRYYSEPLRHARCTEEGLHHAER